MKTLKIDALITEIVAELGEYGNKEGKPTVSDVARDIGISPQRVWAWLIKRQSVPNGEAALLLAEWMTVRKKNQK